MGRSATKGPAGSHLGDTVPASGISCLARRGVCPGAPGSGAHSPHSETRPHRAPPLRATWSFWRAKASLLCCWNNLERECVWTGRTWKPRAPDRTGQQLAALRSTQDTQGLGSHILGTRGGHGRGWGPTTPGPPGQPGRRSRRAGGPFPGELTPEEPAAGKGGSRGPHEPHKWTHLFQLPSWGNTRPKRRVQSSVGS